MTYIDNDLLPVFLQLFEHRHPFLVGQQIGVCASEFPEVYSRGEEHEHRQHVFYHARAFGPRGDALAGHIGLVHVALLARELSIWFRKPINGAFRH